jgi:antitoxin (DNA-binding transcriptional repressor) of toxin-antitoxin stability system
MKARRGITRTMTARELKNATGDVVRTLRQGGSILLTFRGKALGTIEPVRPDQEQSAAVLPFDEAWAEIEAQLEASPPAFPSWQEAEDHSRGRR